MTIAVDSNDRLTALIERPVPDRHDARSVRPFGAYVAERRLVRGPGADLWLARAPDGVRVLVHSVLLRASTSLVEETERQHVLHSTVRSATDPIFESALAQNATERADGILELYWVCPWVKGADRLAKEEPRARSVDELLRIGLSLAKDLVAAHGRGDVRPTLAESFVVRPANETRPPPAEPFAVRPGDAALGRDDVGPILSEPSAARPANEARAIALPVTVPFQWLAHDAIGWRVAPEEALSRQPRATGDIWRLGQTLRALAADLAVPVQVASLLASLDAKPAARPARASEVVVAFEALLALGPAVIEHAQTINLSAMSFEDIDALLLATVGDSTRFEAAAPMHESSNDAPMGAATIAMVTMMPFEPPSQEGQPSPAPQVRVLRPDQEPTWPPGGGLVSVPAADPAELEFFADDDDEEEEDRVEDGSTTTVRSRSLLFGVLMLAGAAVGVIAALQCG